MHVRVENDKLLFGDVGSPFEIEFHRTLRVPDNASVYDLPKGLGQFPIRRVDDYEGALPEAWSKHGGIILPIHFSEALYIGLHSANYTPRAVQVSVGMVNAVDGKPYSDTLREGGYMVAPPQRWMDGINSGAGVIRQFIATRMGDGNSIEAQVTGEEKYGGFQVAVYEPHAHLNLRTHSSPFGSDKPTFQATGEYPAIPKSIDIAKSWRSKGRQHPTPMYSSQRSDMEGFRSFATESAAPVTEMSVGAGGKITQKLYPDPHGVHVWNTANLGATFIHLISAQDWYKLTGEWLASPISQNMYELQGIPWFKLYDSYMPDTAPSPILRRVKSVRQMNEDVGIRPQADKPMAAGVAKTSNYPMNFNPDKYPGTFVRKGDSED